MRRSYVVSLLIFFAILLTFSIVALYYAYQTPIYESIVTTSYEYQSQGTFNYTAMLQPNLIYDKTTLGKGEGTIFKRITDSIVLDFAYRFNSSKPSNITVSYKTHEYLITSLWTKDIGETPEQLLTASGVEANVAVNDIPVLNVSENDHLVSLINQETGLYASQYTVNVTVQIHVDADYDGGNVSRQFTPQLSADFRSTATEGEIISIGGLEDLETGRITNTGTIFRQWVVNERYAFLGLLLFSLIGCIVTGWQYQKSRPPSDEVTQDKIIEETIAPYEEIVVETADEPKREEDATIVMVKTLENLARIADILSKPILQTQKPEGKVGFQVVDGNTRYKYEATVSELKKESAGEED
jgi:hypothetical protein